jgi:hypothetical protein
MAQEKFVNVLVQTGRKRDNRIKDVPTIYELMDKYQYCGGRPKPGDAGTRRRRFRPSLRDAVEHTGGTRQDDSRGVCENFE